MGILESIKKMLGISSDCEDFDPELILHINSSLMILSQIGIGENFVITGNTEEWSDLIGDRLDLEAIKSYIYLKVRLMFDPPTITSLIESIDRQITQLEWRLNVQSEEYEEGETEDEEDEC